MPYIKNKIFYWAVIVLSIGFCYVEALGNGDFVIFLSAAGDLSHQTDIFTKAYVDGYHYYYSVLFAILLKPLYFLPVFCVKFAWLLLNVFLYLQLFKLLTVSTLLQALPEKQKNIFLLLVFIFSFRFLLDNIHASQITILILSCCVYGLRFIQQGKTMSGSAILALGINIKLLPIVFLPYLLFRGYYKAFGFTILFYVLALFLPSLVIGHAYNMELLSSWWNLINPVHQKHVLDVEERSFHGLSTLLSTLLVKDVPDIYALGIQRNIADVSLKTLSAVLLIIRVTLIAFTLYFLKGSYFRAEKNNLKNSIEISYILLLIPLIFPHQQHYAFLFMVPAFSVILFVWIKNHAAFKNKWLVPGILSIIYLCANLKLVLGTFNNYYEHFKILTYGALLLIPLLVWARRHGELYRSGVSQ